MVILFLALYIMERGVWRSLGYHQALGSLNLVPKGGHIMHEFCSYYNWGS